MAGQDFDYIFALSTIILPPLVVALVAVLTPRSLRQTILTLTLGALGAFIVGVALYDVQTGVRSARFLIYGHENLRLYLLSSGLLGTTRWLLIAALAFALWEGANHHQWRWFAGLALTLLITVGVFAAFSGDLASTDLFGGVLSLGGVGGPTYAAHDFTSNENRVFYIVVETLMLLVTLPPLLYALRAPHLNGQESPSLAGS